MATKPKTVYEFDIIEEETGLAHTPMNWALMDKLYLWLLWNTTYEKDIELLLRKVSVVRLYG